MPTSRRTTLGWLFILTLAIVCTLGYGFRVEPPVAESGDSPQYLSAAYHLRHYGTFTELTTTSMAPPSIGREPGYAILLAGLMMVSESFDRFTPDCLHVPASCDAAIYRPAQWLNAGFIGLAGLALFATVLRLTNSVVAAGTAGGYLLLNLQMHDWRHYVISDHLAVLLVTLVMLATVWAWQAAPQRPWRWALVGLLLAGLTLVKAVFAFFTVSAILGAAVIVLMRPAGSRRPVFTALAILLVVYGAVVGGWMTRNKAVDGSFRLTDARSGIALSTREVFNHMTAEQYAASFVYWTRGFGDSLARKIFRPEVVAPFDLSQPGGFYDVGQHGYAPRVHGAMQAHGLSERDAINRIDAELRQAILMRPFTHLATTIPLIYRGIWIDEFIVIGLPALLWAAIRAVRRHQWLVATLLSLGLFNLTFYAVISLNIPRYQMTAVPVLATAAGLALQFVLERRRARKGKTLRQVGG